MLKVYGPKTVPPSAEDFSLKFGQVTWLATVAKDCRDLPICWLEANFAAPLAMQQVEILMKGKQPIAALSWAWASLEVKEKLASHDSSPILSDWRSGPNITVIRCISPFTEPKNMINKYENLIKKRFSEN